MDKTNEVTESYTPENPLAITKLQVEGFKRVRNVTITPATVGLTKIGGNNRQGKTSVLDALAHDLCGAATVAAGANLINDEAEKIPGTRNTKARTTAEFSDGTRVVTRLTDDNNRIGIVEITLPTGEEGTIEDLRNCISKVALVPPSMEAMSERERLKHLLGAVNVDLTDLVAKLASVTKEREGLYEAKERAQKHANDLVFHEGVPTTEEKASTITAELQTIMTANSANQAARQRVDELRSTATQKAARQKTKHARMVELSEQLKKAEEEYEEAKAECKAADEAATIAAATSIPKDLPTDALQTKLEAIDAINQKVRDNQTKAKRNEEAAELRAAWSAKESEQVGVLREMKERVAAADIPLSDLGIDDDLRVVFAGQPWANCSGMQKAIVRTAIASLYQPNARFVLADGLEQLDEPSQALFHKWAISRNLQVIGTEVRSNYAGEDGGDGVARFVISDGMVQE